MSEKSAAAAEPPPPPPPPQDVGLPALEEKLKVVVVPSQRLLAVAMIFLPRHQRHVVVK